MTASSTRALHVRPYAPADREQVLGLIQEVWGEHKRRDYEVLWDWKERWSEENCENKGGHCSRVVEREGRILGFAGVIPMRVRLGGRNIQGGFGTETLTSPAERGSGIKLMRGMLEDSDVLIGSANERTSVLWGKIGKIDDPSISDVTKLVHVVNLRALVAKKGIPSVFGIPFEIGLHALRWALLAGAGARGVYRLEAVTEFGPEMDEFDARFASEHKNVGRRGTRYLNWRFGECPLKYEKRLLRHDSEVCGYIVFRETEVRGRKLLLILEMLAAGGNQSGAYRMLAAEAVRFALAKGATDIQTLDSGCVTMRKALRGLLFLPKREQQSVMLWVHERLGLTPVETTEAYSKEHWFLTAGDGEFEFIFFDQKPAELTAWSTPRA